MKKRLFDISFSLTLLLILVIPMIIISLVILLSSRGSIIFWSERLGKNNKPFDMPKFRTMKIDTPIVASHLLSNPESHITWYGNFLRKLSLDELPQLWSILSGKMSVIGYRPVLSNQTDLINLRNKFGINLYKPGLTGWAQVNGRDNLTTEEKVLLEKSYYSDMNIFKDIYIIILTIKKVVTSEGINH